jgi:hypothetical protein
MVKSAIRDVWDEGKARMVLAASYWEVAGKSHKRMIGKLRLYGLYRKSQIPLIPPIVGTGTGLEGHDRVREWVVKYAHSKRSNPLLGIKDKPVQSVKT